jgi:hypothetical protein
MLEVDIKPAVLRAEICRTYLLVAARPDLAATIGTNRAGHPMRRQEGYGSEDAVLVARAFTVTYRGDPLFDSDLMGHVAALVWPVKDPGLPRHWSPLLDRWVATFDPAHWASWEATL